MRREATWDVAGWESETVEWKRDYREALVALDKEFPAAPAAANAQHTVPLTVTMADMNAVMKSVYRQSSIIYMDSFGHYSTKPE